MRFIEKIRKNTAFYKITFKQVRFPYPALTQSAQPCGFLFFRVTFRVTLVANIAIKRKRAATTYCGGCSLILLRIKNLIYSFLHFIEIVSRCCKQFLSRWICLFCSPLIINYFSCNFINGFLLY